MNNQLRKEFHDMYISEDMSKIDQIIQAMPTSVIKFYRGTYINEKNYNLEALKAQKLWLSSPQYFNDPFDCVANIDYEEVIYQKKVDWFHKICEESFANELLNNESVKPYIEWTVKKEAEKYKDNLKRIRDSIFVSCFSEPINLTSLRMWGYYADSHRGYCMEYDIRDFYNISNFMEIVPVYYSDNYLFCEKVKTSCEVRAFKMTFAFTKAYEWNYEKEWRVFAVDVNEIGKAGFLAPFITPIRVYLGCKINERLKRDLLAICKKMKIDVYQVYMVSNSYKLECKKIEID